MIAKQHNVQCFGLYFHSGLYGDMVKSYIADRKMCVFHTRGGKQADKSKVHSEIPFFFSCLFVQCNL